MQILKNTVVVIVMLAAFFSAVYHFYIKGRRRKDRNPAPLDSLTLDLPPVNFDMVTDFYHNPNAYTIMIAEQPEKSGIKYGATITVICSEKGKEIPNKLYLVDKEVKPYGVVLKLSKEPAI